MPNLQWHPPFVTSIRETLSDALPGQVEVEAEVALSSKPLDIDVLVVKRDEGVHLIHPVTKIFRRYNVFEYKNPLDRLEPNDYDKGLTIARLYKAIKHPTLLTIDDFTVTFVCTRYPGAFFRMLEKRRLAVEKANPVPGLYQVAGDWMPVQVLVLKGLTRPEDAYMFAPFLTGRKPIRTDATALLLRKYMDDPTNPYLQELIEFKFKNELVNNEEMEVLTEMVAQANVAQKTLMKQLLGKHPLGREMAEDAKIEGRIEGKIEGKIEAKQDVILKYLMRRFGGQSPDIQKQVQQLNDLEILDDILSELLVSNSLRQAEEIIQGGLKRLLRL